MDDERHWLEDEPSTRRPSRRAVAIGVAAAVPWLAVAAIVLLPSRGSAPDTDGAPTATAADAVPDGHTPDPRTRQDDHVPSVDDLLDEVTIVQLQGGWRDAPGPAAAGAVATVAARAWLTGHAPRLDIDGLDSLGGDTYVEHVAVEAVEQMDADIAVVSMLAVVLHGDPLVVDWRRLAVAVRVDGTAPRPAGDPWWLPEPELRLEPLVGEPVDDPLIALQVVEALDQAGYRDVELVALERTASWPWRAHVDARTPAGRRVDTPVLLRQHPQGFTVAGIVDEGWR